MFLAIISLWLLVLNGNDDIDTIPVNLKPIPSLNLKYVDYDVNKIIKLSQLELPTKMDWREHGVVSKVRLQGKCGGCWAYSVIETIETMAAIQQNTSDSADLSVQQVIDCAQLNNHGCKGGDICMLLEWLLENDIGILSRNEYPDDSNGWFGECKVNKTDTKFGTRIKGYQCKDFSGKEYDLLKILAYHGPVAAAVNAELWKTYDGGIIQTHCSDTNSTTLNHAVQIVGYDLTSPIPFYIIKNSWGKKFGNKGYIYIEIGKNLCGLVNEVAIAYV